MLTIVSSSSERIEFAESCNDSVWSFALFCSDIRLITLSLTSITSLKVNDMSPSSRSNKYDISSGGVLSSITMNAFFASFKNIPSSSLSEASKTEPPPITRYVFSILLPSSTVFCRKVKSFVSREIVRVTP